MITLLLLAAATAQSQDVGIGQWQAHLPFRVGVSAAQSETTVFLAFESQIALIDKVEFSVERLNKVNGLSDVNIRVIRYNPTLDVLLVAYSNGNVDLVKADGIVNINAIQTSLTYIDKEINAIFFEGDFAYLSCNFGIVQLNVVRNEVAATFAFRDPERVNATVVQGGIVYAFTDEGIFEGDLSKNLLDFDNWERQDEAAGIAENTRSRTATLMGGELYADINDTLKRFDGSRWQKFQVYEWNGNSFDTLSQFFNPNYFLKNIQPNYANDAIVVTWAGKTSPARTATVAPNKAYFIGYEPDFFADLNEAIADQQGRTWLVDATRGAAVQAGGSYSAIVPNAPFNSNVEQLTVANNQLWVASGTLRNWTAQNDFSGAFRLNEGEWARYSSSSSDTLAGVSDFVRVAVNPINGKVYLGTFSRGVVEINGDKIKVFNAGTSLQPDILDASKYKISGMAFDAEGNLWVSNYGATRPISVYKTNGTWESFVLPAQYQRITNVVVDNNGYKWFATKSSGSGNGVVVFDEGDLNRSGDERFTVLTSSNSVLPNNDVISLAVDLRGEVWVGTSQGTMLFECPSLVFQGDCEGRRVVAESDDFGDYLLKAQTINTIMIDGANRKWFGTTAGIFVQSADGREDILRLNARNSPLLSDNIRTLAFNEATGEVFIGTDRGILSYRSDATTGTELHDEAQILAFPNPVRPDYEGTVAIRGLVRDANVKITDIQGGLMFEGTANGGQVVWNGRDYNGRRAASGVYLVFSSRTDGTDAVVTKILFLN